MTENNCEQEEKPRKRLWLLVTGVIAVLLFCWTGYTIFGGDAEVPVNTTNAASVPSAEGKINILVLGVDERKDEVGRSDTTFVVTIDTNEKKLSILSIPRDTRVQINGHGWDKINHAYALGGKKLSQESVQNLLGISIDYIITVNFSGFVRMIDAIGGVQVDVEKRMYYYDPYDDNGGLLIDLRPGKQLLNGKTAVQYVRFRDDEGDIGRVGRQQKFMKAVLQEFTKPQIITKLPDLIKQFNSLIKTDIPISKMLELSTIISDIANAGLVTETIPGTPVYIQEVSYWIPNISELRQMVARSQNITLDEHFNSITEQKAKEYQASLPKEIQVGEAESAAKSAPVTKKEMHRLVSHEVNKVSVINASGNVIAGNKLADYLRKNKFTVTSITNTANTRANTLIILGHADKKAISQINKFEFNYQLQISNDQEASGEDMVIQVGKDYLDSLQ